MAKHSVLIAEKPESADKWTVRKPWRNCWSKSALKRVAHFIVERDGYLRCRCGAMWWMSDAASETDPTNEDIPLCRRCAYLVYRDEQRRYQHPGAGAEPRGPGAREGGRR